VLIGVSVAAIAMSTAIAGRSEGRVQINSSGLIHSGSARDY